MLPHTSTHVTLHVGMLTVGLRPIARNRAIALLHDQPQCWWSEICLSNTRGPSPSPHPSLTPDLHPRRPGVNPLRSRHPRVEGGERGGG